MPKKTTPARIAKGPVPVNLPPELKTLVRDTAQALGLSQQDTIRQSLRRGLPILKQIMTAA